MAREDAEMLWRVAERVRAGQIVPVHYEKPLNELANRLASPVPLDLDALEQKRLASTFAMPVKVEGGSDPMIRDDHGWWVAQVCSKSDVEMDDDGRANAEYIAALINAAPALVAAARRGVEDTREIRWQSYRHGFLDGLSQPVEVQRAGYETWSAHAEAHAAVYADVHTIAARAHPEDTTNATV